MRHGTCTRGSGGLVLCRNSGSKVSNSVTPVDHRRYSFNGNFCVKADALRPLALIYSRDGPGFCAMGLSVAKLGILGIRVNLR